MRIQDKALLVGLNISQWTARKLDKTASKATADMFNAQGSEIRTTKAAIAKKHLDEINKIVGKVRTYHYERTLPYSKGQAILATAVFPEYMSETSKLSQQFNDAVEKFLNNYDVLKDEARGSLGNLFNQQDYPTVKELKSKFSMTVDFAPIPEGSNLRINIDEDDLKNIQAEIQDKVDSATKAAMSELWARVYQVVESFIERLTPDAEGETKTFRDTLVSNIQDLADLLPKMNLTDDADLNDMANDLKKELAGLIPSELRQDNVKRKSALSKATSILNKVRSIMGAPEVIEATQAEIKPVEKAPAAIVESADNDITQKMKDAGIL